MDILVHILVQVSEFVCQGFVVRGFQTVFILFVKDLLRF